MRTSFRETLWFKYGQLDSEAAAELDEDEDLPPLTPSLPIEDRYADDGTMSEWDTAQFGIHTGSTSALAPIDVDIDAEDVEPAEIRYLAKEIGGFRRFVPALVVVSAVFAATGAALAFI